MRFALRLCAGLGAVCAVSGCLHEERMLKGRIDDVTPRGFERIGCSFASGSWGGEPASESCVYVVPRATAAGATRRLRVALQARAGAVGTRGGGDVLELTATHDGVDYRARVSDTAGGLLHFLAPPRLPSGSVGVVIHARESD